MATQLQYSCLKNPVDRGAWWAAVHGVAQSWTWLMRLSSSSMEFGMDLITLLCLKWTTNKDLLYSTGNSAQCYVAAWIKVRFGREWTYMYTYGWVPSLFTWNCQNIVNWLCAESLQSCMTLCNPMDCSPLGSSVHGILQARILEWVAMPSSKRSSQPRDQTCIS